MSDSDRIVELATEGERIGDLAIEGLYTDGAHHKQWYLEQILHVLRVELPAESEVERGTAP